ncbi:hypothetical protein [Flavobacterium sp. H122]|uniref:hypothetical protein n=1 Tax=Flavobacterium sp. H122 TaxID=2529860 RepID=UPI0010AB0467|nr:hypothetical protein [Flavobacterium sp. H122]
MSHFNAKDSVYFGKIFEEKLVNISVLTAKEVPYDWKKLKISKSHLYYNPEIPEKDNVKGIDNFKDYTNLVIKRYKWSLSVNLPEGKNIEKISLNYFNNEDTNIEVNANTFKLKAEDSIIPDEIRVDYGAGSRNFDYSFDGFEILTAFKKLDAISNSEAIKLICDIKNKNSSHCFLKKGNVTIPLKDIYK